MGGREPESDQPHGVVTFGQLRHLLHTATYDQRTLDLADALLASCPPAEELAFAPVNTWALLNVYRSRQRRQHRCEQTWPLGTDAFVASLERVTDASVAAASFVVDKGVVVVWLNLAMDRLVGCIARPTLDDRPRSNDLLL